MKDLCNCKLCKSYIEIVASQTQSRMSLIYWWKSVALDYDDRHIFDIFNNTGLSGGLLEPYSLNKGLMGWITDIRGLLEPVF